MRSDQTLPKEEFRRTDQWQFDALAGTARPEIDRRYQQGHVQDDAGRRWHSFSGNERNCLFVNHGGVTFQDASALSGADNVADGRACAILDFDHDGWPDIALVNANYPLLNIYHNQLAAADQSAGEGNFIAVRLVGGNRASQPTSEFSNRDAIGAKVSVALPEFTIVRELRCGEGFAAQNSRTLLIGIGRNQRTLTLTVDWPSGKSSRTGKINAGQLVTVFENLADSPDGLSYIQDVYRSPTPVGVGQQDGPARPAVHLESAPESPKSKLRLITTMATWCAACKQHLPQIAHLRAMFSEDQLQLLGVPFDPIETRAQLESYVQRFQPAYQLSLVSASELATIRQALRSTIRTESLPATLMTDARGVVLEAFDGLPTASDVGKWLDTQSR